MSIIKSRGGVALSIKSKALILNPAAEAYLYGKTKSQITLPSDNLAANNVALWGDDNLLPFEMMKNIENTGVLNAAIEVKARIAIGKGPALCKIAGRTSDGQEILEFVTDRKITDWMERSNMIADSYSLAKDLLSTGNPFDNLILTKDRSEIYGFERMDPTECRFSKMNAATRRSEYVYMSSDWREFANTEDVLSDDHMARIPLLNKKHPLLDLQERTSGESFMVSTQYSLFGRKYYALPMWWSAREWIKMAQGIPELKKAILKNQMNINYIVEIHPLFWENHDPRYKDVDDKVKIEIQEEFYDAIEESLIGAENSYKSLFSTTIPGLHGATPQPGVKITKIDGKLKEGELLLDSSAADSNILFAMMINPALIGVGKPGGGEMGSGSGANIREAYLTQVMLMEIERNLIATRFNLAKGYNRWNPDYTLRFPNSLLTTLNTGANTKPIA